MKERNKQANAIFEGGKLSVSLAHPQSAKQANAILMKERNGQPNAIFEGEKLSVSLSVSLADPNPLNKRMDVMLINERKKWTAKCNI